MGAENTKSVASQPAPLLSTPWRTINWGDQRSDMQYVKNYKPQNKGHQLRILLHGPVGAGKSSFINSVQSVLHGRIYTQALANNSGDCFTKQYTTYKILNKEGLETHYPFVFNDVMGLRKDGIHVKDIKLALNGHIKEGYKFKPEALQKDDAFYKTCPNPSDKVHVLVCVIPANTYPIMREDIVWKIREVRKEASALRLPQLVILTKIDEACPDISRDLKDVYRVEYLKEMMEQISVDLGIPMNCIFPVKNYHEEISLDNDTDSLILSALKNIINFGEDFLNFMSDQSACSENS